MAFLTAEQLAKAQAECEGFQNGPQPALNPANLNTQSKIGNPQAPTTTPAPYYPSQETPNLQLTTDDMPSALANNFVILDSLLAGYTPGSVVPVILASEQFVNTTSTQSISITAAATQMYALSIYMNTKGLGLAGQTVTATISYTAADGSGLQIISLILPLNTANVVMETYPLLALGGTAISITTAYAGAYNPVYTIGASIVQMPS
jgi:hypothetical protein